jgi:hypothetical protein
VISNVLLLVKSLSSSVTRAKGGLVLPNFIDIDRNKQRLAQMRAQSHQGGFNLNDARRMADTERADNVLCRERQKESMMHWFGDTRRSEVEQIEQRINDIDRGRRAGMPLIEPLPSIEDSFLAWTNEDECLFDPSIKESWRDFDDDQTALVLASPYALDDDLEIDADLLVEILAHEDNRRSVFEESAAPIRANSSFWVE